VREYERVLRDHVALVTRATAFAGRRHAGQIRKHTTGEPFLSHLAEVAELLATSLTEPDAHLVAAGWLHDAVEKADVSEQELEARFGPFVAELVIEVSDDQSLPREERRRLQVVETPGKSDAARMLKLADKTSNLRALAANAATAGSRDNLLEEIAFAEAVAAACEGLNRALDDAFSEAVAAARSSLSPSR
jgi:(p)ppGpp synthase/HD superfamily hydrolase